MRLFAVADDLSAPMPGTKWSTVLVTESIGTRSTSDHVVPFVEVTYTMSFDEHPLRKRQSCHAT